MKFSFTNDFSQSNLFSISDAFSKSDVFTKSYFFTKSDDFSESDFLPSCNFIRSLEFTISEYFSKSNEFTSSLIFSQSKSFSKEIQKNPAVFTSLSISYSISFVTIKSVSYSLSYLSSNTFMMSYLEEENTYYISITQNYYANYFPYIIHYLSPVQISTFIGVIIPRKNKISPEQLIGVVCGSVSVFFLILGIIILAIRKKNYDREDDFALSDFSLNGFGYIKSEDFLNYTKERIQIYFENTIKYCDFDDLHLIKPDLYVHDTMRLLYLDDDKLKKVSEVLDDSNLYLIGDNEKFECKKI